MLFLSGTFTVNEAYYGEDFRRDGAVWPYMRLEGSRGTAAGRRVQRLYARAMRMYFTGGKRRVCTRRGAWKAEGDEVVRVTWHSETDEGDVGGSMVFGRAVVPGARATPSV